MKDYIIKAIAYNHQVRAYAAITTNTIEEARRRHGLNAIASEILGRTMSLGVILGTMLKGKQKLTIKINGGGEVGTILVDANAKGEVRGNVTNPNPPAVQNEQGLLDIKSVVGTDGILSITKDIGFNHSFVGQVPIISGEIVEDFSFYLLNSEQVPSYVGVEVLTNPDLTIKSAGGFIIQLMPGIEEETIQIIEERLKIILPLSLMMEQDLSPEQILYQILGEENVTILETSSVQFRCDCSRDRFSNGIISLGSEEILDMIEMDGQAEAQCHFCNERYYYTREDLEALLKESCYSI